MHSKPFFPLFMKNASPNDCILHLVFAQADGSLNFSFIFLQFNFCVFSFSSMDVSFVPLTFQHIFAVTPFDIQENPHSFMSTGVESDTKFCGPRWLHNTRLITTYSQHFCQTLNGFTPLLYIAGKWLHYCICKADTQTCTYAETHTHTDPVQ